MNTYETGGGRHIGANDDISAVNGITANRKLKSKYVELTATSTCTGDISTPNIYTQTEINQFFTRKRLHMI